MTIAGGVMLLSLVLGSAADGEDPAPKAVPPPTLHEHREPEGMQAPVAAPEPSVLRRWYGWQLLLADAASLTLGIAGKSGAPAVGATLGFSLAAPALHFAHGDDMIGGISLFVRAAVLGIVAADGVSWDVNDQSSCHSDVCKKTIDDVLPALVALSAGIAFVIVDDTFLSIERAPAPRGPAFAFAPTLAPTSGGMSMGLVGVF